MNTTKKARDKKQQSSVKYIIEWAKKIQQFCWSLEALREFIPASFLLVIDTPKGIGSNSMKTIRPVSFPAHHYVILDLDVRMNFTSTVAQLLFEELQCLQ